MAIEVGEKAPIFTLPSSTGDPVDLETVLAERSVVLVFYPFTFTGVCLGELCELRDDISSFERSNVQVLAISCDSRHSQRKWAEEEGFGFPVLSDFWPHGEVSRAYGVFDENLGAAKRHTFAIDRSGIVVATFSSAQLSTPREKQEYEEALAKLG
jgi:peroxiredoxin